MQKGTFYRGSFFIIFVKIVVALDRLLR